MHGVRDVRQRRLCHDVYEHLYIDSVEVGQLPQRLWKRRQVMVADTACCETGALAETGGERRQRVDRSHLTVFACV